MRSWVAFLRDIPHLSCRIYIDDIYLWAKIQFVANLKLALEVTKLWDSLVGQKLNQDKSVVWASNASARKTIKHEFPGFLLQETFDVLGTKIYTSQRNAFDFSDEKAQKIYGDIRNIGALPRLLGPRSFHNARLLPISPRSLRQSLTRFKLKSRKHSGVSVRTGEPSTLL